MRDAPRERHVDELLLLNLSEEFFENEGAVQYARSLMLDNPNPQDPEGFARQLGASSRHDARDRLPSLSMPVHVIGGERDILVPVWKSKELAELIPGARLTVLERAPHGLTMERAMEFNELMLGLPGRARAGRCLNGRRPPVAGRHCLVLEGPYPSDASHASVRRIPSARSTAGS